AGQAGLDQAHASRKAIVPAADRRRERAPRAHPGGAHPAGAPAAGPAPGETDGSRKGHALRRAAAAGGAGRTTGNGEGRAMKEVVTICECFARDGLQHEEAFVPTATKIALIDMFTD